MPQYVVISREHYGAKKLRPHANFAFLAREALVPIVNAELHAVALSMPIGFVEQKGRYTLVAVMSFIPGRNLFVGPDNQWLGKYIPAMFRGYPFRLLRQEGSEDFVLGVDEDSPLIADANETGEAFYDEEGKPTASVKAMMTFLTGVERSRTATDLALAALAKASVIRPWEIKIKMGDGEKPVTGLHRIDEVALNALSDDQFLQLRKASALSIAYAQLISIGQTTALERLVMLQENLQKAQKPTLPEQIVFDVDTLNKVR
jgi:hypothetical protein